MADGKVAERAQAAKGEDLALHRRAMRDASLSQQDTLGPPARTGCVDEEKRVPPADRRQARHGPAVQRIAAVEKRVAALGRVALVLLEPDDALDERAARCDAA